MISDLKSQISNIHDQIKKSPPKSTVFFRCEVPLTGSWDPLKWVAQQSDDHKIYWVDRDHQFSVGAVGTCWEVSGDDFESIEAIQTRLKAVLSIGKSQPRLYGGFRFSRNRSTSDEWASFSPVQFVLPKFEVFLTNNSPHLAANLLIDPTTDIDTQISTILSALSDLKFDLIDSSSSLEQAVISQTHTPTNTDWQASVEKVLTLIRTKQLSKLVLARRTDFQFEKPINPFDCLANVHCQNSFQFVFSPSSDAAFWGVAPELLFSRQGKTIRTEAVAGTRQRGNTESEDQALALELLQSTKDNHEHELVLLSIRSLLHKFCESVEADDMISILKLPTLQHLLFRYQGVLKGAVTDDDLLNAFHPTPAVGGFPRHEALGHLSEIETIDRGWYAGPVGWINAEGSCFAVAIRSGLVRNNKLSYFAGAGIVKQSDASKEWDELNLKMQSILNVLNIKDSQLEPA